MLGVQQPQFVTRQILSRREADLLVKGMCSTVYDVILVAVMESWKVPGRSRHATRQKI